MANTTADKLAKLLSTRRAMKDAINGSGNTVGDVFADYPPAVSNGRAGIAAAITEKGVQTSADAPFDVLETNVRAIETGGVLFTIKNTYENAKPPESAKGGEYVVFSAGSASIKILSDSGNRIPILSSGSFGKKTISFVMPNENIVVSQDV